MLELLFCSIFTLLPDYLYRRFAQGKRLGKEITFYSVWYELRWGITGCIILTVCLITTVFYFHPSTNNVTAFFRTIPIVPETNGRVAETFVGFSGPVAAGAPIFRLDNSKQQAAVEAARHKVAELDAQAVVAQADVVKADGQIKQATSARQQTLDELETKRELYRRNPETLHSVKSSGSKCAPKANWARSPRPPPPNKARKNGSPPSFLRKKGVPKPSWPKPKSIST